MRRLVDMFISAVELVEAEGRDLRQWAFRVGASIGLVLVAAVLVGVGVLLVAGAVYLALDRQFGPIAALTVVGVILVACAGGLWWKASTMIDQKR